MSEPITPPPSPPGGLPPTAPPPGGPPAARTGLPWELSKDIGALIDTAKRLITSPAQAFAEAREKGDFGSPLLFAVIFMIIGAIFQQLWQLLFGAGVWSQVMSSMGDLPPEAREAMMSFAATGPMSLVIGIIMTPILGIIVLFIWSGLVHLTLQLVGGLKESTAGFEGTFRSASYASVAQVSLVIPFVGQLIYMVWVIVLQMMGLASLHRTSQGKGLAAVLIPIAVCCCIGLGIAMAFGAAIIAAIGAAANN